MQTAPPNNRINTNVSNVWPFPTAEPDTPVTKTTVINVKFALTALAVATAPRDRLPTDKADAKRLLFLPIPANANGMITIPDSSRKTPTVASAFRPRRVVGMFTVRTLRFPCPTKRMTLRTFVCGRAQRSTVHSRRTN